MRLLKALMMAALAAALFCLPAQAGAVATGCLTVTYPGTGGYPSYLDAPAAFDSGPFPDGIYDVFCANGPMDIYLATNYRVVIYSLNDPAITNLGLVQNPANLVWVEWILNQSYPGLPSAGFGNFNSDDVQAAIWILLDGFASPNSLSTLPNYSQDRVNEILGAVADEQANGGGLQPLCTGVTAYLANPVAATCGGGQGSDGGPATAQPLIFGVPRTCPGPPLLVSECAATGTGEVGVPYSSSLVASGGTAPYTFSITGGELPPGLTLNPTTGAITGIPTTGGTFAFTYSVVDSGGESGSQTVGASCSIVVSSPPPVDLECVSVTTGKVGVAYNASLQAGGGTAPYTFSITAGSLPPGLTLNPATGAIAGTPTAAGAFNFTATVVDQFGLSSVQTDSVDCAITVTQICTPVSLGCVAASSGTVGTAYSAQLSVTGGVAPYTFSIIYGSLPPGLSLNPTTGIISGTPTMAGSFSFKAKVVDSALAACGCSSYDTVYCCIKIVSNCTPVNLGCVSTTPGTVGTTYTATLSATGGSAPYTFSIVSGCLPPGLTLNKTTGTISGTPTKSGTFSFTAKVVDSSGAACGCYRYDTVCCSIKINPPPSSGCDCLVSGDTATIGYWQGPNGQALIKSLNGGSTSKQLATWLASNFPYLYGAYAGADNLTGKSNADVAALFKTFFAIRGQKTKAQTLAAALAVYVTDSDLAGNTATASGFNVSASGTGAKCYNVGCYGSSIGLTNNKNYTVMALLEQADLKKKQGCFNANSFNAIFDGINVKGDRL